MRWQAYQLLIGLWVFGMCFAQTPRTRSTLREQETLLQRFLQSYLNQPFSSKDAAYFAAFEDLNGDGQNEAIVYLTGNDWCGSGGCTLIVLAPTLNSWRILKKEPITRPPIRVLTEVSHGWHSLGVWVEGGGIQPGYEAKLRFNGRTYSADDGPPVDSSSGVAAAGKTVVPSTAKGAPVFPQLADGSRELPSFDCAKASTPTEKLICKDADLASMDSALAAAYRELLQKVAADQQATVRREQSEWFTKYARACNSVPADAERKACVVRYLSDRTQDLRLR